MKKIIRLLGISSCLLFAASSFADVFIRYNQAGYTPQRPKQLIVMSDNDLTGKSWQVTDKNNDVLFTGRFASSLIGKSDHTAKDFHYEVDVSALQSLGEFTFAIDNSSTQVIKIVESPYQHRLSPMLRFLRVARSGTDDTLLSEKSHMGDAQAQIYRPTGESSLGQWQPDTDGKKVDMLGGWYDAADYIKFTLTTSYTAYYLLRAYQESPALFVKEYSNSSLVDVLDEAKHGLNYLVKTFPSDDEFIIQVSTGIDHLQGYRLPHLDTRDGQREALSAISPAQMGMTSAALALGAKIFSEVGEAALADKYLEQAKRIYARALEPDALKHTAFERDKTNDFYLDKVAEDNMGLAAIELFKATNDEQYLLQAKQYSELAGNGEWAAWCCVTASLNYRLSNDNENSGVLLNEELSGYQNYDAEAGNIWGIPMVPSWAPLPGNAIAGAYSGLRYLQSTDSEPTLLWDNLDYYFGRNNWGTSFVAMKDLKRPAINVYSQIYKLTGEYPLGAVAEGPGSRQTYESLSSYFKTSAEDAYFDAFNTRTQIFYDNSSNFQTMESTIVGQATAIYLLAVAEKVGSAYIANVSENENFSSGEQLSNEVQSKQGSGGSIFYLILYFLPIALLRNKQNNNEKGH